MSTKTTTLTLTMDRDKRIGAFLIGSVMSLLPMIVVPQYAHPYYLIVFFLTGILAVLTRQQFENY